MRCLIVNCKVYREASRKYLHKLVKQVDEVQGKSDKLRIIVCVSALYLESLAKQFPRLTFFSQSVDGIGFGAHTGHISPYQVKEVGGSGTLLNHSEKRIPEAEIVNCVVHCKKANLEVCLCVENKEEIKKYESLQVDFIAIEPPELIGGEISISEDRPSLIKDCVELSEKPLLVGAGIKTKQDVEIAKELGAEGILVSSGIVRAENPRQVLEELVEVFEP